MNEVPGIRNIVYMFDIYVLNYSNTLLTARNTTKVSTDELNRRQRIADQTLLRREEPCHVKDILKKETY